MSRPGPAQVRGGRRWNTVPGALAVGLVAALVAGCTGDPGDPTGSGGSAAAGSARAALLPGCPAQGVQSTSATALPDLQLPCLGAVDGAPGLPLRRLTGRPTVLNLWASWCAPCRQELPALSRLSRDAGSRLRVIGIASQDRPGDATAFAADAGLPFPSLQDPTGDLGRALRRRGLPLTVLLAADGSVMEVYQGRPLTDATLRALVRDELGVDV